MQEKNQSGLLCFCASLSYKPTGHKLRKTVTDGGVHIYRQGYVGGIEYRSTSTVSLSLESIYHPEGRVFNTNTGTTGADALRYEYSIRDHLGNTRLTFADKNNDGKVDISTTSANEDLSERHYYPFGLALNGPWMDDAAARDNPYRYNGKELNSDFGLGWYDYGARWYDAAVGRWWSIDLLARKHRDFSPYNYVRQNPLLYADLMGLDTIINGGELREVEITSSKAAPSVQSDSYGNTSSFAFLGEVNYSFISNSAAEYLRGFIGAFVEDNSLGLIEREEAEPDYEEMGREAGDFFAILWGLTETTGGIILATTAGTVEVSTAGVASPVAVPAVSTGGAATVHGLSVAGYVLQMKGKRAKSTDNASEQFEGIERAQKEAKKEKPSTQNGEWEGAKKRPKQNQIQSTKKSKDREHHQLKKKF